MEVRAAVVNPGRVLAVESIRLDPPKPGEVLVNMRAVGVCQSDMAVITGKIPQPLPMVLGHEGSGEVAAIGEGGAHYAGGGEIQVGDRVVLSMTPICGDCYFCTREQSFLCTAADKADYGMPDGTTRYWRKQQRGKDDAVVDDKEEHQEEERLKVFTNLGCMSTRCVVPGISCVRLPDAVPFDLGALVGCGVMTGFGAAVNAAQLTTGSTVAVFGCGGVGLSAVQGARIAGATTIIAVDTNPVKLAMAFDFGATATVQPNTGITSSAVAPTKSHEEDRFVPTRVAENVPGAIRNLTGGVGADACIEAVGSGSLMDTAHASTRKGGRCVVVGVGPADEQLSLSARRLPLDSKSVVGCFYGNANPVTDFPRVFGLWESGVLELRKMVTRTYTLDDANAAFDDLSAGINARGVILIE